MALAKWLISAIMNSVLGPRPLRTIETLPINSGSAGGARYVFAALNRDIVIRNPATNTVVLKLGAKEKNNNDSNLDFSSPTLLNPGEEMVSPADPCQYYITQNVTVAVANQFVVIEQAFNLGA